MTDGQLHTSRAMAQTRIAKIASLSGAGSKTIAEYQQAVALWKKLVAKETGNLEFQAHLAETLKSARHCTMASGGAGR